MSKVSPHLRQKYEQLVQAGEQAFVLLLEQVKKPIDEDLSDDKARNAMKAKRECFMDAQTILDETRKIEAILSGDEVSDVNGDFTAGHAEKYARK